MFGLPIVNNIHSADVTVPYAATDRFRLSVTVPHLDGKPSAVRPDTVRHDAHAFGLGDISLVGTAWLLNPETHAKGNVALGVGLGGPHTRDPYGAKRYRANRAEIQHPRAA